MYIARHEARSRYHELALHGWADLYGEQKEALQKSLGEDTFVASLIVAADKKTGEEMSYAVWTRSVPTLLPRAEHIIFTDLDAQGKPSAVVGIADWDRVLEVCGAHLEKQGTSPERWATGDYFPGADERKRLGLATKPF